MTALLLCFDSPVDVDFGGGGGGAFLFAFTASLFGGGGTFGGDEVPLEDVGGEEGGATLVFSFREPGGLGDDLDSSEDVACCCDRAGTLFSLFVLPVLFWGGGGTFGLAELLFVGGGTGDFGSLIDVDFGGAAIFFSPVVPLVSCLGGVGDFTEFIGGLGGAGRDFIELLSVLPPEILSVLGGLGGFGGEASLERLGGEAGFGGFAGGLLDAGGEEVPL